jgi:hypothetical protein
MGSKRTRVFATFSSIVTIELSYVAATGLRWSNMPSPRFDFSQDEVTNPLVPDALGPNHHAADSA